MFIWIKCAQSIGGVKHASVYGTSRTRCVVALVTECPVSQGRITFRRSIVNTGSDGMAPISDSICESDCTVLEEPGRAWGCLAAAVL